MKILFAADLHLNIPAKNPRTGENSLQGLSRATEQEDPEMVVVAGDIGSPETATVHLSAIRRAVGDRHLVICLGNHDLWVQPHLLHDFPAFDTVRIRFWDKACEEAGVILLDRENAELGDIVVTGGYGHFDLGLAAPGLSLHGVTITDDLYLKLGAEIWNDFRYIPNCAARSLLEAKIQAVEFEMRLFKAIDSGKRVFVATHTCPWRHLNAHPLTGSPSDLISAYSGNSLIGRILEEQANSIELVVCGHTHLPVREQSHCGVLNLNLGADYGVFRGVLYDTSIPQIKWVGKPLGT